MRRDKKGQAAMEFLMTYGWAILAAIIVVGVLWYMIGNPANLAGDKFVMSGTDGFVANAMSMSASVNEIVLEIRNGQASTVNITGITLSSAGTTFCSYNINTGIPAGQLQAFTITGCSMTVGDRVNQDVVFSYTTPGSTVTQAATGTVSGRAQ